MPVASVRGASINYEVLGDSGPWVSLTPGGRRDLGGVRYLAEKVAAQGFRVLLHDRRNCGASDVVLEGDDPEALAYNTSPPVEFGARGLDVDVAWTGGSTMKVSGNSFATPHVAGMVARVLSKHPGLTPFQVKAVLHAVARNAD